MKPSKVFFNAGIFFFMVIWLPSAFFVDNFYIKAIALIAAFIVGGFMLGLSLITIQQGWDDELMARAEEDRLEREKNKKEGE